MPEKNNRETLKDMKAFARKSFESAIEGFEDSRTYEQKDEYEQRALQAITAYAAADAALSADPV